MSRPKGGLERTLAELTIGLATGERDRRLALADTRTGEYEQQIQVPLAGNAGSSYSYSDKPVQWAWPFVYAPLQRRVPFQTPHFTYGIEITAGSGNLVAIHAQVIDWTVTDQGWYVGATIRFASYAPSAPSSTVYPFSAVAHLRFSGYASMAETDEFAT
jgi:hypothetical protein